MYRNFPTGASNLYIVVIYSVYNLLRKLWNSSLLRDKKGICLFFFTINRRRLWVRVTEYIGNPARTL
jgi:hypothetical protein